MPTIHDLLELSTTHLPPQVADQLSSIPGVHACATVYGWLMWIPDPGDDPSAVLGGCDVLAIRPGPGLRVRPVRPRRGGHRRPAVLGLVTGGPNRSHHP
jgi:hypothetical protein